MYFRSKDTFRSLVRSLGRHKVLIGVVVTAVLYAFYIWGLSTNPPGSYLDESCLAYNGYLIAQTGASESGTSFPLFAQCYTQDWTQYMDPVLTYLLAAVYYVFPPDVLTARILSATLVFVATLLLGVLAVRITGRLLIGVVVAVTAMATPWLFEISRLIQETSVLVLSIVLFLLFLYNASRREKWKPSDNFLLGISLALITYSYPAGRVLAPALAFALLVFAVNRQAFLEVVKTWVVYGITLIPFITVYLTNGNVITARFREVSYITPDKSWSWLAGEFFSDFFKDLSPVFLLLEGDTLQRHHVPGMGEIYAATLVLALLGVIFILLLHRRDLWWRYILLGLMISVLPGAIAVYRHHALRLVALPVFLLVLTIPAFTWLIGDEDKRPTSLNDELRTQGRFTSLFSKRKRERSNAWRFGGRIALVVLLLLTFVQAVFFQLEFRELGPNRSFFFDASYPKVLEAALAQPSRPIYLKDGYWGPAYIHAYWYGAIQGINPSNFVHLMMNEPPPPGSVVLSSDNECKNCEKILQDGAYLLYAVQQVNFTPPADAVKDAAPDVGLKSSIVFGEQGTGPGQLLQPRGIVADSAGNMYVADSGNARIQEFDPKGTPLRSFGTPGFGEGELKEPNGIALDSAGNFYVTDAVNQKLVKFKSDGTFAKEWKGPAPGFYGPRDIAIAPNGWLYIIDQGQLRVARFDPVAESFTTWGSLGAEPGQFSEATGICIGGGFVFVADQGNQRIQVFDLEGKFVRQWGVPVWGNYPYNYPDAVFDEKFKRLYVTSGRSNEILEFDADGTQLADLRPQGDAALNDPASLAISEANKKRELLVLNTASSKVTVFELER